MSNRIAVVCEGPSDFPVARALIDQTLLRCAELHWIHDDADLGVHVAYGGLVKNEPFIKWTNIDADSTKDYRRSLRSVFKEQWPEHDIAVRVQRVLFEFLRRSSDAGEAPPYIVIVKDTDNDQARADQLRAVRALLEAKKLLAVLGVQHTELECWLLCGFDPETDAERQRLTEVCRGEFPPGVGFNPCEKSHQLTATKKDQDKLSPKRVLNHLTNGDPTRAITGLHRDRHAVLKARGTENGLAEFLRDIEQRLIFGVFGVRAATN